MIATYTVWEHDGDYTLAEGREPPTFADGTEQEPKAVKVTSFVASGRDVALAKMETFLKMGRGEWSPENRESFDRILALRDRIGPIDFNVVEELRKMREGEE